MLGFCRAALPGFLVAGWVLGGAPARAEVLEEIVAIVNGEIVTSSEFEEEEQAMMAAAYREFTGDELDRQVKQLRENMLLEMIDRKIIIDRARAMFQDIDSIKNSYYEGVKQSENITDDAEFARLLAQQGMTIESFKDMLFERFVPEEVLRIEVGSRISVSDREIEAYYESHIEEFTAAETVTVREIVLLADSDEQKQARRAEADQIVERARGGEDFAELAQTLSDAGTKGDGGLLESLKRGDLSAQLEEVAFGIVEGEISAPIETPYGYHILMVEERGGGNQTDLDDVRERLRTLLEDKKYNEALIRYRNKSRAESEWCVKAKFRDRLSEGVNAQICETM